MTLDLDSVRRIARGFAAGHTLAGDGYAARAKTARNDDSSTALIRESLQLQADAEHRVAGEFATVADLLDRVANPYRQQQQDDRVIRTHDAGGWVPGGEA